MFKSYSFFKTKIKDQKSQQESRSFLNCSPLLTGCPWTVQAHPELSSGNPPGFSLPTLVTSHLVLWTIFKNLRMSRSWGDGSAGKSTCSASLPIRVRSPEPSKMPGCDPSMGKAKTGDPWNDMANLEECAGSGFQWEILCQYVRWTEINEGTWIQPPHSYAHRCMSPAYMYAHSHTCACMHACAHMHTILINASRH